MKTKLITVVRKLQFQNKFHLKQQNAKHFARLVRQLTELSNKSIILLIVLLLPASSLFAQPFDMILTGEPVLADIRFVSLESGRGLLSFTPPLAPAKVENFLDSIDPSLLSGAALEAYYRIRRRLVPQAALSFTSDIFTAFIDINATLEARVRFNTDINWYPKYHTNAPLLSAPIRFFLGNALQFYFEPIVMLPPHLFNEGNRFGINVMTNNSDIDVTLPYRAFIAAGGSWWNFQLGRDRLFWGTGNTGSLTFADYAPYFEFVRLSFFSRNFKYTLLVNQMPLDIRHGLIGPSTSPSRPPDWENGLTMTTQRHFYLHRFDASFFNNRLSIGIMEGAMIGNSALELRFLNPLMIFHSFMSWLDYETWAGELHRGHMIGSFFSVEVNWNIVPSLSVYGQFLMHEFALPGEIHTTDHVAPNSLGFMAGLNFTRSFNVWGASFFLESFYTFPFLHMTSTPFGSFIQMRRTSWRETGVQYYFIGYPRDTISLTLGANLFRGDVLNIGGRFAWRAMGERSTIIWDWDMDYTTNFDKRTPTGTAQHNFIATVTADWQALPRLGFNGSITGIVARNNRHISGSGSAGGQAAFSVTFSY